MSHRSSESTSFSTIGATLIPTVITATAFLTAFCLLRKPYRNIYAPRTYIKSIPEKDRTPSSSTSAFSWFHDFRRIEDRFLLRHSSIDAYLFLRFLRVIIIICTVGCCLTWPILFPINALGGGDSTQLDKIAFGNVNDQRKLYAHAVVAWVFFTFITLLITRERLFSIRLRQSHAAIKQNALRLSSRVVLFLSAPKAALGDPKEIFGPAAVRSWPAPDLSKLETLIAERSSHIETLEEAELALQQTVTKKAQQSGRTQFDDTIAKQHDAPGQKSYYIVGERSHSLTALRQDLPAIETKINEIREKHEDKTAKAVFVEFEDAHAAQQAYQTIHHQNPFSLRPRHTPVQPKEVLWSNLNLEQPTRISYHYFAIAFIIAITIFWSIPVGIVGTISNIKNLADKVDWLQWIYDLPSPILGLLTGYLPALILSELVSYVPIFFRYIAKQSGEATTVEAEKMTQRWYFVFQVVQVFLVTTFSSGAAAVATKIANEPTSVPALLARNLPKASNFYLSYFIIQGLGSAPKNVLNFSDLFFFVVYDYFFDKTPRQKYTRYSSMKGIAWGKVYPKFTNFAVIAIVYSCIAPLVLGFAAFGVWLFYLQYRYNLMYVVQVKLEPRGVCYTTALRQMTTGVYLAELCLLGLFSIKSATGPMAMMVVLLMATIVYHITVDQYLVPMESYLPSDVLREQDEDEPLLSAEEGRPQEHSARSSRLPHLPFKFLDPMAAFLESSVLPSHTSLRPWLQDPHNDDDIPSYTDDEVKNAYLNPALTSKTPTAWIPKDQQGVSEKEIKENQASGITTTDEGAELDSKCNLLIDRDDFSTMPVFKQPKRF